VPRRVSLPGASELFRPTHSDPYLEADGTVRANWGAGRTRGRSDALGTPGQPTQIGPAETRAARGTGRVRHDEKITVYVSSDELLALEQARLTLRARYGTAVDRGRIVREAISAALADFTVNGDDSELVRRLTHP
jgi:hypothetical protein